MRRLARRLKEELPRVALLVVGLALVGCERRLVVGELRCSAGEGGAASEDGGVLSAPWSTDFEDGFCGYHRGGGYCYSDEGSSYQLVTSPVRSGTFAAAFDVGPGGFDDTHQARCVRQGALPDAAYYSAWYNIPDDVQDAVNWNLFHYRGGVQGERLTSTWDVSVRHNTAGEPVLILWDLTTREVHYQDVATVPLGRWFHVELFLKRAADETGEVALFQDGQELVRLSNIITDQNPFTQWYVGNLVTSPMTAGGVLFVDDVDVRLAP